jgi:uncharacterized membrane protein
MSNSNSFLSNFLNKNKILIDHSEFEFQLKSHPSAGSLLSISDTLNFFNVSNIALQFPKAEIEKLPNYFLALIKNKDENNSKLVFVENVKKGFIINSNSEKKTLDKEEFRQRFEEKLLVILSENSQKSKKGISKYFLIILLAVSYLLFVLFNNFTFPLLSIVFLLIIGLLFSIEANFKEIGSVGSNLLSKVCGFSNKYDCDSVIQDNNKLTKFLKFNELSLFYFSFILILLLSASNSRELDAFFSFLILTGVLSIPILIVSVYYQKFVIKKWCLICLIITLINVLILILSYSFYEFKINHDLRILIKIIFLGLLLYMSIKYWKKITIKKSELQNSVIKLNKFKRNFPLFKLALNNSKRIIPLISNDQNSILIGNRDSKLNLVLLTNPYCGYCEKAHKIIKRIYNQYPNSLSIEIKFSLDKSVYNDETLTLHTIFFNEYFKANGSTKFLNAFSFWYKHKDLSVFKDKYYEVDNFDKTLEILSEHDTWRENNSFFFTPILVINDMILPFEYEINDLLYYIDDLVDENSNPL